MPFVQLRGPQAETLHSARTKVLYEHIGPGGELAQDFSTRRVLYVDRQRSLTPIRRDEEGGKLVCRSDLCAAAARDVAADRFDLQHISALVGEKHGRNGTRHHSGQVQHANSG
jgi:hypothetical protein